MKTVLAAHAKINLALDIIGRQPNGYHELDMLVHSVDRIDGVTVETDCACPLTVVCGGVPMEDNLAYKAARLYLDTVGISGDGIRITIDKHIPFSAGLGGGSADAAAVLCGLNDLFGSRLTQDELCAIAPTLGADVPFCVKGGAMRVRGIGEELEPVAPLRGGFFVLAKCEKKPSTAEMYRRYDTSPAAVSERPDIDALVAALEAGDMTAAGAGMRNVFEHLWQCGSTDRIRAAMTRCGALGCTVSGSGPTVYGYFESYPSALKCKKLLREFCDFVCVCMPSCRGVTAPRDLK